jgi:hypothetical protein
MRGRVSVLALLLVLMPAGIARSETKPPPSKQDATSSMPVSVEQALYLIRSTLLTLNDANRTGNYTVLRDLAAPDFQAKNTAADLGQVFADLRRRNLDLFAVALIGPQLSTAPYLDPDKRLRLTGYFRTRPLQINFDLTFQVVNGQWRLFGITVATPPAPEPTPAEKNKKKKNKPPKGKN